MTIGAVAVDARRQVAEISGVRWLRHRRVDRIHIAAVCLALPFLALLEWRLPYPVTGSDGGNWLGLSGGLIGIHANAASTVYPPMFLILLAAIRELIPPIEALRLTALLVTLLPGFACYALLRTLGLGRLASVIHPYPTQAEAIRQCGDAYNRTRLTPKVKKWMGRWLAWQRS